MTSLRSTEKEVTIKAPWGNIKALTWGNSNNPPVVLGSGRQSPCSTVRSLVLRLPENFFYIAFDFPGNGNSDYLPKGVRFTVFDLIPSLLKVSDHFKCERFIYVAHSLGTVVGKFFNMAYPGRMTRVVEIDPIPSYINTMPEQIGAWYQSIYGGHYEDHTYNIHTSSIDTAPKYSYEEVKKMLVKAQYFKESDEDIDYEKEGYVRRGEDGLYRFTHDQRMKSSFSLPFSPESLKQMYTRSTIPILSIYASNTIESGVYKRTPFIFDESAWPNNNYNYKIVKGNHNVHILDPECMADDISKFLLEEIKAKL